MLLGGSCGEDRTAKRSADEVDTEMLEGYVQALADGDVDAAIELRCHESRISASQHREFERQRHRLIEDTGRIGLSRVEIDSRHPWVVRSLRGRNPVMLRYWLTVDGTEVPASLLALVVDDDGDRRLCAGLTGAYPEIQDGLRDAIDIGAPVTSSLSALMPPAPASGDRPFRDEAIDASTLTGPLHGARDGWIRMWHRGATVAAYRFPSSAAARKAADGWLAERSTAIDAFAVPGVPAQGVRSLGYAWLWVQPSTRGPYIDEVTMVLGDTVVIAGISVASGDPRHEAAIAQAQEVIRLAT